MFKKLVKQLREDKAVNSNSNITSPIKPLKNSAQVSYLKNLSKHALDLYERKTEVKNFTKLVLSNPENTSHNELVEELFSNKSITDAFSDEALFELSENKRFMEDLGL